MNKRLDNLIADLQQRRHRFANQIANAHATPAVTLHETPRDDPAFGQLASRFVTAVAAQSKLGVVYAIQIDNWFGPRWLGFCGKFRGIAGVRNKTLRKSLTIPPFHPNRVVSARGYHLREDGLYADAENVRSLHPHARSETLLYRSIRGHILHAWYSGNTFSTGKGVVMIYYRKGDTSRAFYTMFNRDRNWRLDQHVGITRAEVESLIEPQSCERAT